MFRERNDELVKIEVADTGKPLSEAIEVDVVTGGDGPMKFSVPENKNPLFKAFFESVKEVGYPLTNDINGEQQEGFGKFDQTIHRARRMSASQAYLWPVKDREKLTLLNRAMAHKILFEGKKPVGVEFKHKGKIKKVYVQWRCKKPVNEYPSLSPWRAPFI